MISREILKEIILSNEEFILYKIKNILKREGIYFPQKVNKVKILYGVRRSGKTFIFFDLFKKYKGPSLYIDFEDERLEDFELSDFEVLKEVFLELKSDFLNNKKVFFFDEIQNIKGWEKFCRRTVEKDNINVFVTGSSSKIMPLEIHTSLGGRAWSIEVTPFSFIEYLRAKNITISKNSAYGSKKIFMKKHFSDYLNWGGFPEVVFAETEFEKNKILKEYLGSIFFKDLIKRFKISNITLLNVLMDKMFSSFSLKLSLTSFYNQYKGKFPFSKDSLFNYYKYFLESMIIFEVRKFSESSYKRMRNPAKIYLVDTGLARKVSSQDLGRILENVVFLELRKRAEQVFYFEEEKECDFIVIRNNKSFPYQVCFELTEENKERELNGLILACKWLKTKEGIILTNQQEDEITREGIRVKIIPVWKWIITTKFDEKK